jgi:hypothetical protein
MPTDIVELEEIVSESFEPILPSIVPSTSCFSRLTHAMACMLNPIARVVRGVISKPHQIIIQAISLFSSLPVALFALTFSSGIAPTDITLTWWYSLSIQNQIFSITNALVGVLINMLTNAKYLPKVVQLLREAIEQGRHSISRAVKHTILLMLGLTAALVYGAIAYESFGWLGISASLAIGATNFFIYGARRYYGVNFLAEKMLNLFSNDRRFQAAIVNQLKQLAIAHRLEFDNFCRQHDINETSVVELLHHVYDKAVLFESELIFDPRPFSHTIKNSIYSLLNNINGLIAFICVFPIGLEKGYKGFSILTFSQFSNFNLISSLLIGLLPAVINAIFYFTSTTDCEQTFRHVYQSCKQDPKKTPLVILLLFCNLLAATGYYSIAKSVLDHENLMGIPSDSAVSELLAFANAFYVFYTGINNTDILFADQQKIESTFDQYIEWLHQHSLSKESICALRSHSFFSNSKKTLKGNGLSLCVKESIKESARMLITLRV